HAPSALVLRNAARRTVHEGLQGEADCLSLHEHELIERMLITQAPVPLQDVEEMEAALTLRFRLWCDVGLLDGEPMALLDPALVEPLQQAFARPEHTAIRARIFSFHAMLHAMMYMSGFLDDRLPRQRFMTDVLENATCGQEEERLARNFLEASYDCVLLPQCRLLVHPALSDPEALVTAMSENGAFQIPNLTPMQMLGSMNGMMPEGATEALALAIADALRPEVSCQEALEDIRMLIKQGASNTVLHEVLAAMLCVLPTRHMDALLCRLQAETMQWMPKWNAQPLAAAASMQTFGMLH
ncbi:MAG: hypothetical protein RR482_09965, partial [Clostridia bacterium]